MFGFGRRKKKSEGTASTFVEATGGGWTDAPEVMAADGGANADYVGDVLRLARIHAVSHSIPVGEEFEFTIANIPMGITSPHEIVFGLMMRAEEFGLSAGVMFDEKVTFTRIE